MCLRKARFILVWPAFKTTHLKIENIVDFLNFMIYIRVVNLLLYKKRMFNIQKRNYLLVLESFLATPSFYIININIVSNLYFLYTFLNSNLSIYTSGFSVFVNYIERLRLLSFSRVCFKVSSRKTHPH